MNIYSNVTDELANGHVVYVGLNVPKAYTIYHIVYSILYIFYHLEMILPIKERR